MTTQPTNKNNDEFGRDLALKNKQAADDFIAEIYRKYYGMSWSEIIFAIEDEEEEKELKKLQEKNKQNMEYRRYLYNIGNYELEEGEILE